MATVTAILIGSGGELDRVTFDTNKDDNFYLSDVLDAVVAENGEGWTLGDGDTIRIEVSAE